MSSNTLEDYLIKYHNNKFATPFINTFVRTEYRLDIVAASVDWENCVACGIGTSEWFPREFTVILEELKPRYPKRTWKSASQATNSFDTKFLPVSSSEVGFQIHSNFFVSWQLADRSFSLIKLTESTVVSVWTPIALQDGKPNFQQKQKGDD